MDEQLFLTVADAKLGQIETALERLIDVNDVDIDVELKAGGVMEIACANGSKIIVNRQTPNREIWVAARSGGFHFAWKNESWRGTRDDRELFAVLTECASMQAGEPVRIAQ